MKTAIRFSRHPVRTGLRRASGVLLLIAAGLAAASCGGGGSAAETRVLQAALSGSPDTLDPQATSGTLTFQVLKSVYDTLAEPDMEGRIVPSLAERWEVSADGLRWTFLLRDGVTFHNGDPFTSDDVRATLVRIADPATGSPFAADYSSIESIETPDARTVVLVLSEPYAPLLATLASGWSAILPAALIESGHDFAADPVGTGPYRIAEWVPDSRFVLERNPSYWMEGVPSIERIHLNVIPERSIQVQGLLNGDLDIGSSEAITPEDLPLLEREPAVSVQRDLTSLVLVLPMNTRRPPLDDPIVRQAISLAVDRQRVLDVAYGGGETIGTFMDSGDFYYADFTDLYPFDPERARRLFAEAGVTDKTELEITVPQNYDQHVKAGELYQEMLAAAGLKTRIRMVDWPTWISDVYRGAQFDLTAIGHTGRLDPDGRFKEQSYTGWHDPRIPPLLDEARRIPDPDRRYGLYRQVLEIMAEEVPFAYIGTPYRYLGTRTRVKGFRLVPKLDSYDFRFAEWTE